MSPVIKINVVGSFVTAEISHFSANNQQRWRLNDREISHEEDIYRMCTFISESFISQLGNHVLNWNKIVSATERVLKLFQSYFSNNEHVAKHSRTAMSLRNNFELISGKLIPRAEMKLFQTHVDEGWNNFELILFHV